MPNVCTWRPSMVTLRDGRQVLSDSEEWLFECLARQVLRWPLNQRKDFLFGKPDAFNERRGGFFKALGEKKAAELAQIIEAIFYDWKAYTDNRQ